MYIYQFLFLFIFTRYAYCGNCSPKIPKTAETRLREKLFSCYNKNVRPVKSASNQTSVFFQLHPTNIDMVHYFDSIIVEGYVLYHWTDKFLTWDKREFEGIDFLKVSSDEIWVPDITSDAPSEYVSKFTLMNTVDCHVSDDGKVYCFPRTTISAYCPADLTRYPFDIHNCSIMFSSFGYYGIYLNLSLYDSNYGIHFDYYHPSKNWEIVQHSIESRSKYIAPEDNSTYYPYITCNFILKRISTHQQAILVLPATGLALLTLLTFWMGSMYSYRLMISGISILGNVLYLTNVGYIVSSSTGNNVPIIIVFFRDSLIISVYAALITILRRNMIMKTSEPYDWITSLTSKVESSFFAIILLSEPPPSPPKDDDTVNMIDSSELKITPWLQLATIIDRFSFTITFIALTVLFFFYLP